jgi:cytochrome c peroxidase
VTLRVKGWRTGGNSEVVEAVAAVTGKDADYFKFKAPALRNV